MKVAREEQTIEFAIILTKSQQWTKAVLSQIERIEKNMNSELYLDQVQRLADDHYLKISIYKLLEWLKELDKYVEGVKSYLDSIESLFDIKLLRDTAEHEIDYYKRIGNKQGEFINKEYNQSLLRCLIINEEYYIGGKINMNQLEIMIKNIDILLEECNFTMKSEAIYKLADLMKKQIV